MNKRRLHHQLKPARHVSPWVLIGLTVVFGVISAFALRQNNVNAINLRNKVLATDQAGGDTDKALRELRTYVHAHMNTDLSTTTSVYPPIQLKHRYERLVNQEKERVSKLNEKIYLDAQAHCEAQNPTDFSGINRVPCIEEYVSGKGEQPKQVAENLYKFDFVSPAWSADLAGWSLVATSVFALLALIRLGLEFWVKTTHI